MPESTIAIIAVDPDAPAETYVRQHIRRIMPGRTVVVYFQGEGKCLSGIPSIKVERAASFGRIGQAFRSGYNCMMHGYPGAVTGRSAANVTRFLQDHGVKAAFAEFGSTGCAILPVCRALGIKLIVNFHGYDATVMPRRWVIRQAYKHLDKYVDGYVCGSNHFAGVLRGIGLDAEKINVVPCGIELDEFDATAEKDPNLIIAVGRLTPKKSPQSTIRAFAGVKEHFPVARLEMIGDGPLMPECKNLVIELGLESHVILHGSKPHDFVKEKLKHASVFVQHSVTAPNGDTESQGISLLEAMASGVPVVTTDHNGFSETVQHGDTGLLVDEHDVQAMSDSIKRLLADPGLRYRLGISGRRRVEMEFDSSLLTTKLMKCLSTLNDKSIM